MDIQGIVYLVDPATAIAYTYDLADPVAVGTVVWSDISSPPRLALYDDWATRLSEKMKASAASSPVSPSTE